MLTDLPSPFLSIWLWPFDSSLRVEWVQQRKLSTFLRVGSRVFRTRNIDECCAYGEMWGTKQFRLLTLAGCWVHSNQRGCSKFMCSLPFTTEAGIFS